MSTVAKRRVMLICVLFCCLLLFPTIHLSAEQATTVNIPDRTLKEKETKDVHIIIQDVVQLGSFQMNLSWDPQVIDIQDIHGKNEFTVTAYINQDQGYANFTGYTLTNETGTIEPIGLTIKAVGTAGSQTEISIDYCELLNADPQPSSLDHDVNQGIITIEKNDDGGGGGNGGGKTTPSHSNQAPIANISLSDSFGQVQTTITLDASQSKDPDGSIVSYQWDLGDGTKQEGTLITHFYINPGDYTIGLTVIDDDGATDKETQVIMIAPAANNPPDRPDITGPEKGTQQHLYTFSFHSEDRDDDALIYHIDWGDGTNSTLSQTANNSTSSTTHQWDIFGKYTITVMADDTKTISETGLHVICIDVYEMSYDGQFLGLLTDEDGDGIYDLFNDSAEWVSYDSDQDFYLVDLDRDDEWDYRYQNSSDTVTKYDSQAFIADGKMQNAMMLIGGVIILVIIIGGILFWYTKQKKI